MVTLRNILSKAIEHYGSNATAEIMNATLIQDLKPLVAHVHLSSNIAKKNLSRAWLESLLISGRIMKILRKS